MTQIKCNANSRQASGTTRAQKATHWKYVSHRNSDALKIAIQMISRGNSFREVVEATKIPKSTLLNWWEKVRVLVSPTPMITI